MIIDCAFYRDGRRQHVGAMSLEDAAAGCEAGGFVWLGHVRTHRTTSWPRSARASACTNWPSRTRRTFHLRPKVEPYDGDVQLVILRTARYDDEREEVDFGEISVFLGPDFVITVRQGVASELHGARARLEQRPELLESGSDVGALGDPGPGRRRLRARSSPSWNATSSRSRRRCSPARSRRPSGSTSCAARSTDFYRAVHPLLAVLATIERSAPRHQLLPYFRDVHDHLVLVNEEVAAQRDLLATVLEANMAVISVEQTKVSVRQNATIEQLTMLRHDLPAADLRHRVLRSELRLAGRPHRRRWDFLVFGIGGLLLPCVALAIWFRRQRTARHST